mmetsp:Transcript_47469/g.92696  ORF Transcript_47469/g.92696 Transcript_47469/m.92696 type:complete len:94 (-) Transcript_47469:184-465(-)
MKDPVPEHGSLPESLWSAVALSSPNQWLMRPGRPGDQGVTVDASLVISEGMRSDNNRGETLDFRRLELKAHGGAAGVSNPDERPWRSKYFERE